MSCTRWRLLQSRWHVRLLLHGHVIAGCWPDVPVFPAVWHWHLSFLRKSPLPLQALWNISRCFYRQPAVFTARLMHSVIYAVTRCPSVRLSQWCIESRRLNWSGCFFAQRLFLALLSLVIRRYSGISENKGTSLWKLIQNGERSRFSVFFRYMTYVCQLCTAIASWWYRALTLFRTYVHHELSLLYKGTVLFKLT